MSRFFSPRFAALKPYAPGEQPKERKFVKLNTNESPFPPSPKAQEAAAKAASALQLYPDPECKALSRCLSEKFGVSPDEVIWTNGSDDILNFAFAAFCDENTPAAFPDITYGFYSVFAEFNGISYRKIPLKKDFSIDISDYFDLKSTVFIANPNAPTGLVLTPLQVEEILKHNRDNVVVIDEAYVDFGGESCIPLIGRYDNLLVTQTFSKSRSMAGARLGFGVGAKDLIRDLNTVRFSTNPYNINAMTMAAGIATLEEEAYTRKNIEKVVENREETKRVLLELGFEMTDSKANFLFIRHPRIGGKEFYEKLRDKGVLVRHFASDRISDYCRVSIGSKEEMNIFLSETKNILEEIGCAVLK